MMRGSKAWRVLLLGALIFALGSCAPAASKNARSLPKQLGFELPDLSGNKLASADLRGRVALLDIWATWCEPCRESLPFYQSLLRRYERVGFEVIAVSVDQEPDAIREFLSDHGLRLRVLHDPRGTLATELDIPTLPTLVLIDRDGSPRWMHSGFEASDRANIEQHVQDLVSR
jgi:peroxiredoxin